MVENFAFHRTDFTCDINTACVLCIGIVDSTKNQITLQPCSKEQWIAVDQAKIRKP